MGKVDKGREDFLANKPKRRAERVARAHVTYVDTVACDALFDQSPGDRDIGLARLRAGWQFDAEERVLLAIEEWGSTHAGPLFRGGAALTKLIADIREGKLCDS